jgi:uncharacterized protein (TIGR03083 family)
MSDPIAALRTSVDRLAGLVAGLSPDQVTAPAYPTEWSIAQVLSHLGSGAEIMALSFDAGLAGTPAPVREANPPIWDRWNAKEPAVQIAEGIQSDQALVERFEALSEEQREQQHFGSFVGEVDAAGLARLRLNEHAVHTWDVAVALDPGATIGPEAVELVVDRLGGIARWAGKPIDRNLVVGVTTADPKRSYTLTLGDAVTLAPGAPDSPDAELVLPAEAFIRLVYGRLDPDHTPPVAVSGVNLDDLRRAFPGF